MHLTNALQRASEPAADYGVRGRRVIQYSVVGVGGTPKRALTTYSPRSVAVAVVGTDSPADVISPTNRADSRVSDSVKSATRLFWLRTTYSVRPTISSPSPLTTLWPWVSI